MQVQCYLVPGQVSSAYPHLMTLVLTPNDMEATVMVDFGDGSIEMHTFVGAKEITHLWPRGVFNLTVSVTSSQIQEVMVR